ncbi:MAG TPA: YbhB/YbcL family Raf kinase inhibitor-like protein [Lachnospiraceae bacterium]|nr:YbhB/YbcL family Raf kinase inhibitor-like protein [Lachnospiraceae bacterium]
MAAVNLEIDYIGMADKDRIPVENTGRGQDLSPEFVLKNLSPGAKTLAVTLEDLTHPVKNFTHWVIWNIPAMDKIPKGIKAGKHVAGLGNACQGIAYGLHRYAGPKPPRGKTHLYRFTVYALDDAVDLSPNSRKKDFLRKAGSHILQTGSILGRFE